MLRNILSRKQSDLVKDEKKWLERLQLALAGFEVTPEDQSTLSKSLHQLDELFLLVIVGEFNSGKSAFINALLGDRFLPEGVTPTTSQIHILRYGPEPGREVEEEGVLAVTYPADFLQEINIVDTPGTNAIIRSHEQLTQNFVPRSDLVIFVTSADRPFTESERAFMEQIRQWGKKVVIILNKIDLIDEPGSGPRRGLYPAERPDPAGLCARDPARVGTAGAAGQADPGPARSTIPCGPRAASRPWKPTSSRRSTKRAGCSSSCRTRWAWASG